LESELFLTGGSGCEIFAPPPAPLSPPPPIPQIYTRIFHFWNSIDLDSA